MLYFLMEAKVNYYTMSGPVTTHTVKGIILYFKCIIYYAPDYIAVGCISMFFDTH